MTTNTLSVEVQPEVPKSFIRGQTMEFIMDLPCDVPAKYFHNTVIENPGPTQVTTSTTTAVTSELRQVQNAGASGKIATLDVRWEDLIEYTKLHFEADNTDNWPLGPAEFDVVFVRTVTVTDASTGQVTSKTKKFRSNPVRITITDGVTA